MQDNDIMKRIRYIAKRKFDTFVDKEWGEGVEHELPDRVAIKCLQNPGVFVEVPKKGTEPESETADVVEEQDAKEQQEQQDKQVEDDTNLEAIRLSVMQMDKESLHDWTLRNCNSFDLDKRKSLPNLQEQVLNMIDQFGV